LLNLAATANSVCIVGIIRIVYTENLYFNTYDTTWASEPIWIWTVVEVHGAIMCASAPALKVFFKRYLGGGTSRNGLNNGTPGYPGPATPGYDLSPRPSKMVKAFKFAGIGYDSGTTGTTGTDSTASARGYETTFSETTTQVGGWEGNGSSFGAGRAAGVAGEVWDGHNATSITSISGGHALADEEMGGSDSTLFTAFPVENRTRSPVSMQNAVYAPSPPRFAKQPYTRHTLFSAL